MDIRERGTTTGTGTDTTTWRLAYLDVAAKEAKEFLNEEQYAHAVQQFVGLAEELDPRRPATVDVERIEDYWELRDKGGVLGKINLRIYFTIIDTTRTIVVLGCWKKEAEGKVPAFIRARIRSRLRFVKDQGQAN